MKNFLILVIVILALLSIDHPSIAKPRAELFGKISNFLGDSTVIKKDQLSKNVVADIKQDERLSNEVQKYLVGMFTHNDGVKRFNTTYCVNGEFNEKLYSDDTRIVCDIIERHMITGH